MHRAELGDDSFNQYRGFRNNFAAARAAQVGQKGAVRTGKTTTAGVRDALERQLMDNLLVLERENIGHPERLKDFLNQSLLGPAFNTAPDNAPTPVPAPAAGKGRSVAAAYERRVRHPLRAGRPAVIDRRYRGTRAATAPPPAGTGRGPGPTRRRT